MRTGHKVIQLDKGHSIANIPHASPSIPEVKDFGSPGHRELGTLSKPVSISSTMDDEEEDDDFEEIEIPTAGPSTGPGTPVNNRPVHPVSTPGTNTTAPSIDDDYADYGESEDDNKEGDEIIRLEIGGETPEEKARRIALATRKKPMTSKDRAIRLEAHKLHVISLLASARIRNRWASDPLLKARLLSLCPHPLQASFNIPPSKLPDRAHRSRLFLTALQSLVDWWCHSFFDISDNSIGLRTRPWDEVHEIVDQLPRLSKADFVGGIFSVKGKEKADMLAEKLELMSQGAGAERLRSINSIMKKALQQEGSRDVSAQLFVSLARACGLGARLVTSLQPVPWRAEKVIPKKKPSGAGRGGRSLASRQGIGPPSEDDDDVDDDDMEEVPIPLAEDAEGGPGEVMGKIKSKSTTRQAGRRRHIDPADVYRLRPSKPAPKTLANPKKKKPNKLDLSDQPPVFWAEIYSRSDQRWIPVDPVKGIVRKKAEYEPKTDSGPVRMLYVVAFEEDGYARDVTLRYTKNFGAKTVKLRVPPRKDESDWWGRIVEFLQRPLRLKRDELEDAELETSQFSEAMPEHMGGFKDHPIYVLDRHLKREEVIQPKREIGRFRGEPVYRRANVLSCKTAENWMRMGRRVKDKQDPLKWVKQRAVTVQKRRAQELAIQENGEAIQQGLYAEYQTEIFRPPPIRDGIIPQNSFGNIDLYAPTMLPEGAAHLPYKGIAKVAKTLGISYAEACTGFEFKNQRAIPTITGIVVAREQKRLVMDAYAASTAAAEERERLRKEDRALKRWVKLVNGLRVKARLQAEYGDGAKLHEQQSNPLAAPPTEELAKVEGKSRRTAASTIAVMTNERTQNWAKRARSSSDSAESEDTPDRMREEPNDEASIDLQTHTEDAEDTIPMPRQSNGCHSGKDDDDVTVVESDEELEEIPISGTQDPDVKTEVQPMKKSLKVTLRTKGTADAHLPMPRQSKINLESPPDIGQVVNSPGRAAAAEDKLAPEEFTNTRAGIQRSSGRTKKAKSALNPRKARPQRAAIAPSTRTLRSRRP